MKNSEEDDKFNQMTLRWKDWQGNDGTEMLNAASDQALQELREVNRSSCEELTDWYII